MSDDLADQRLARRIAAILPGLRFVQQEQDTYTPTYEGGTTPGTTTYAVNGQVGHYVRLGRLVFFHGRIQWTAATGTGQARISLPFTATNVTNLFSSLSVDTNNVTFANSTPTGVLTPGVAYFFMRSPLTNAASTDVAVEAAGVVNFAGFFEVG